MVSKSNTCVGSKKETLGINGDLIFSDERKTAFVFVVKLS